MKQELALFPYFARFVTSEENNHGSRNLPPNGLNRKIRINHFQNENDNVES